MIGNKINEKVSSETEDIEFDAKTPQKRYMSPEKRKQAFNDPRLI